MAKFYSKQEISEIGECLAHCHFAAIGQEIFPIDPEIVATKYFGLNIFPQRQLDSVGVRSGIDTSQSVIFIDYNTYMLDELQPFARQGIAHELGHAIFDSSLLRQLAGTTADDAFELHSFLHTKHPGIETRANMLSGAFLVPRRVMLQRIAKMIAENYETVTELYPDMTLGSVFEQLTSSQLSRYFGVSDRVIGWRFSSEQFHNDFKASSDTLLKSINLKLITKLAGIDYKPVPLTEKLKALLPDEIILSHNIRLAAG